MASQFQTLLKQLKIQETELDTAYKKAQGEVSKLKRLRAKIKKAIFSLQDNEDTNNSKSTVTTSEVKSEIKHLLKEGSVSIEHAREHVSNVLKAQNKSLNGIAIRFKQAIADFSVSNGMISISEIGPSD